MIFIINVVGKDYLQMTLDMFFIDYDLCCGTIPCSGNTCKHFMNGIWQHFHQVLPIYTHYSRDILESDIYGDQRRVKRKNEEEIFLGVQLCYIRICDDDL